MTQTILLTAAIAMLVFGALALHKQVPGVSISGAHMFLIVGGVLAIPFTIDLGSCVVQRGVPCMTHVCQGKPPPREK